MFCTEVIEVFEAADHVHVFFGGAILPAINVHDYVDIEALATAVALAAGEENAA